MKFVWAIIAIVYALLNVYAGYLLFTAGLGAKLLQKGIYLQGPPILGGLALIIVAIPLLWTGIRLAISRTPRYD